MSGTIAFRNLAALLLITILPIVSAIGGLAELKSITGDAPYLGTGNHEIAGEYYMSRLGEQMPYSNYLYSNHHYGQNLYNPYGAGGNYFNSFNNPSTGALNPAGMRFYHGSGNSFINRQ